MVILSREPRACPAPAFLGSPLPHTHVSSPGPRGRFGDAEAAGTFGLWLGSLSIRGHLSALLSQNEAAAPVALLEPSQEEKATPGAWCGERSPLSRAFQGVFPGSVSRKLQESGPPSQLPWPFPCGHAALSPQLPTRVYL